ncbi:MAG: transcriptional regulator, TetR family [Roseomonas sp.]|nr:transcriptional regulator, TetR family [Roseomonas sp.]
MTDPFPDPATPPARAARLPSAERHSQILDAAVEEFAGRGYAGARMAAVATRADVTKGLLYHYFPGGKVDLFKAAIESCVDPVLQEAERVSAGFQGSGHDLLAALLDLGYGRLASERREHILLRLLLTEADRFPELATLYRTAILEPSLALIGSVIRTGIAAGEFRAGAADEPGLAHVLMAPVVMGSIWRMTLGAEQAPALPMLRDAHLAFALRALAP